MLDEALEAGEEGIVCTGTEELEESVVGRGVCEGSNDGGCEGDNLWCVWRRGEIGLEETDVLADGTRVDEVRLFCA